MCLKIIWAVDLEGHEGTFWGNRSSLMFSSGWCLNGGAQKQETHCTVYSGFMHSTVYNVYF